MIGVKTCKLQLLEVAWQDIEFLRHAMDRPLMKTHKFHFVKSSTFLGCYDQISHDRIAPQNNKVLLIDV